MKIYEKGNYVHIVDVNGKLLSAVKKEVEILPTNDEKTEYKIFGFKNISPRDSFSLHHFVKEDGSAFTLLEWEDFYMANTGNYGSSSCSSSTSTIETLTATQHVNLPDNSIALYTIPVTGLDTSKLQQIMISNNNLTHSLQSVDANNIIISIANNSGQTINEVITLTILQK